MIDIQKMTIDEPDPERSNHVQCAQCKKRFVLHWDDGTIGTYRPTTLVIRSCPSGGVYDVLLSCPFCDYEEPL